MSSAISIDGEAGVKARPTPVRPDADVGFQVWHFFVLLSLLAATAAVVVTRQGRPEVLILVSVTIGVVGVAAIALYRVLAPLTAAGFDLIDEPISPRLRTNLEREKALTLRSIKELEFDRAMEKVSSQDFEEMAARLRARAIGIMKQLDADGSPYRAVIEKQLAARLAAEGQAGHRPESHDRRTAGRAVAPACACGTLNDDDARFCKNCGAKIDDGQRGDGHGI